ncbi:hypothetical protein U9M48_032625, partial [Paspalum notatum var. saurae]
VLEMLEHHMKDLGEADVILNINLIKDESGITLSQTHYVEKVLSRFGYIDSKPSPTSYNHSVTLKKNKRIGVNQLKYSQIIGSLMYLASATRPDISFAVSKLSRFMSNPGHPAVLEGYSDANWIFDDELYATSGYVFMLGGGAVSWRSSKQTILIKSTMEAELAALDTASVEADWLLVEKPIPAILMNYNNQTAIAKVNSDKKNAKSSRHVRRRVKSVRKMRHFGVISVTYIQTEKNLADPFTKGLSLASREMGLRNPSSFELLHREKANKVFGKSSARLLAFFTTGRPSSSAARGYRRRLLHGLLHRAAYSTCDVRDTVIVNVIPSTKSALAADRVMCYLKRTMSYGIHYLGHPAVLEGYSDANWISDDELCATSGYVFMLGGGAVSWRSSKQTILTRSTMEAELAALDTACVEADWLRELLMDLPVVKKPIPTILMNCDNQIVIAKVNKG